MLREKKLLNIYPFIFWPLLFISLTILYWPSFNNFFFGDDFYLGILARANSLKEFISFFNIFIPHPQFPFYRPLSFQGYYWTSFWLFKLNSAGYHLIIYLFYLLSLALVFLLTKRLFKNTVLSYLTTFFYAFSNSHFYRLYFIALCQELMLAVFYLFSLIYYLKFIESKKFKFYIYCFLFFVLALTTKETALTLPLIILITDYLFVSKIKNLIKWFKNRFFTLLPMFLVNIFYLFCRLLFFGIARTNEYQLVFNLKSIINNVIWYFLWSLGIPEDFVNIKIKDPTYIINPGFFTEFGKGGAVTACLFVIMAVFLFISAKLLLAAILKKKRKLFIKIICFSILWFLTTIFLVAFFPFHKFSYSVTLPLYGSALMLSLFTKEMLNFSKLFFFLILLLFLMANTSANRFASHNHWVVNRAKIANNIWQYLKTNYPSLSDNKKVYFYDYNYCLPLGQKQHLLSEEIANVLCDEKGLNFLYNTASIKSWYQYKTPLEEINKQGISNKDLIFVSVGQFFVENKK